MNSQISSASALSIDDKRQVIYAALLRFNPEAMELRQRALERMVLNGLQGSTETTPYKVEKIQRNLKKGPQTLELREELIRRALTDLVKNGKAQRIEQKSSKTYFLTKKGEAEIDAVLSQAVDIFDPVLQHMLRHTQPLVSFETAAAVCRTFIMECFGRFGRQIARSVIGQLDKQDLAKSPEVKLAFEAAAHSRNLSEEVYESLYERCVQFIRSMEPQDEKLKFQLTQAFFLSELLCIDAQFDPLSTQAFKGALFYLDTNVVFVGLLTHHSQAGLFEEMLRMAVRLGIELRITRATINEARRVIANRHADLKRYVDNLRVEMNDVIHDNFLSAYHDLGTVDPHLTPAKFFERFDRLTEILQQDWKVQIDDRTEDEILGQATLEDEAKIFQEESVNSRKSEKSDQVLRHDLAQLAVIRSERLKNPKTWLLTVDRSLIRAASQLTTKQAPKAAAAKAAAATATGSSRDAQANSLKAAPDDSIPFCFSLAGFLQSISPFTATYMEERSVTDTFSTLVTEYLSPSETLFDLTEMNLLMEWHADVMRTPPPQLIRALDYIKSNVLHGRQYSVDDLPKVALELKKFLASSTEEQQRALAMEAQRRAEQVKEEQRARALLEAELKNERSRREEADVAHAEERRLDQLAARSRQWRDRLIFGLLVSAAIWIFQDGLVSWALSKGLDPRWEGEIRTAIVILAFLSLLVPAWFFLRSVPWRGDSIALVISILVLAVLAAFARFAETTLSKWSNWIQIATFAGGIIYLVFTRNRKLPPAKTDNKGLPRQ